MRLAHFFLGPIYAVLNFAYQYYMAKWFGARIYSEPLELNPDWLLLFNLYIYALQFTIYHSYEILRHLRDKEKVTQELLALQKEQELTFKITEIALYMS